MSWREAAVLDAARSGLQSRADWLVGRVGLLLREGPADPSLPGSVRQLAERALARSGAWMVWRHDMSSSGEVVLPASTALGGRGAPAAGGHLGQERGMAL